MVLQTNRPAELVFAYLFSGDGQGKLIDEQTALKWLKLSSHTGREYLWLHFNSPHGIGKHWLQYIELAAAFKDALHKERRSSRLTHSHHGLFAVMNDVSYDISRRKPPEVATLWIGIRQHWLLSAWDKPLRSVETVIGLVHAQNIFPSTLSLVVQLLSEQAEVLLEIERNAAQATNVIEDELAAESRLPKR